MSEGLHFRLLSAFFENPPARPGTLPVVLEEATAPRWSLRGSAVANDSAAPPT